MYKLSKITAHIKLLTNQETRLNGLLEQVKKENNPDREADVIRTIKRTTDKRNNLQSQLNKVLNQTPK